MCISSKACACLCVQTTYACVLCRFPHQRLSDPFPVIDLNLQQRVDAIAAIAASSSSSAAALPPLQWESDQTMPVTVSTGGIWNAVAFWFEVCPQNVC